MLVAPALVVAMAVGGGLLALRDDGGSTSGDEPTTTVARDAVAVTSDAPRVASLAELVASADVVLRGEVVATERGRWFGDGTSRGARIQSRFVTLRVDEVLAGRAPGADTVLIEEEGWTEDGAPLVVDGAGPSRKGDVGVWFVADGLDPDTGAYLVVSAQGRYLVEGDGDGAALRGADLDDPLVAEVEAGTLDDLVDDVRAVDPGP